MECFPADGISESEMAGLMHELISAGLIIEYEHNSQRFWQVTGWHHQRIDKPSYKYGPLKNDGIPLPFGERSASTRRPFGDGYPADRSLPESTGRESISAAALLESRGVAETASGKQAAAEFLKKAKGECVTKAANALMKYCVGVTPQVLWQVAWVGCCLGPDFVADALDRMKNSKEPIRSHRRYLLGSVRAECENRGLDFQALMDAVPPAPKVKEVAG